MIVLTFTITVTPLKMGISEQLFEPSYKYIEALIWFIFALDVLINLRSTYKDREDNEVSEDRKIAKYYLSSTQFVFDVLTLVNLPELFVPKTSFA